MLCARLPFHASDLQSGSIQSFLCISVQFSYNYLHFPVCYLIIPPVYLPLADCKAVKYRIQSIALRRFCFPEGIGSIRRLWDGKISLFVTYCPIHLISPLVIKRKFRSWYRQMINICLFKGNVLLLRPVAASAAGRSDFRIRKGKCLNFSGLILYFNFHILCPFIALRRIQLMDPVASRLKPHKGLWGVLFRGPLLYHFPCIRSDQLQPGSCQKSSGTTIRLGNLYNDCIIFHHQLQSLFHTVCNGKINRLCQNIAALRCLLLCKAVFSFFKPLF